MGEIGEAVGDHQFEIGIDRGVLGECIAEGPVATFFVGEAMFGEQVFVVGVEQGQFFVLTTIATRADRTGKGGRGDAVSLELVKMFIE